MRNVAEYDAIVVDPSSMQIVANAMDQTHKHDTPEGNTFSEENADVTCSLNERISNGSNLSLPGSFLSKRDRLNMEMSCINPWVDEKKNL
jgi:tRNA-specific adenosine deaminase 3